MPCFVYITKQKRKERTRLKQQRQKENQNCCFCYYYIIVISISLNCGATGYTLSDCMKKKEKKKQRKTETKSTKNQTEVKGKLDENTKLFKHWCTFKMQMNVLIRLANVKNNLYLTQESITTVIRPKVISSILPPPWFVCCYILKLFCHFWKFENVYRI